MAYIKETGSEKWQAQAYIGKDPATGVQKRKYKTFKRKRDAENWAKEVELEAANGIVIQSSNITIKEYLENWLEDYALYNVKGTTYDGYNAIIQSHLIPALGAIKLEDLQPVHIQSYISQKRFKGRRDGRPGGLSELTIQKHYRLLSKVLNQAVKWQLIKYNPIKAVDAPSPKKRSKERAVAMTKEQLKKLLETAKTEDPWMYNFIYTAAYTGMRRSELLGLQWENVDFKNKVIRVREVLVQKIGEGAKLRDETKTQTSTRAIKISDDLAELLEEIKKDQQADADFMGDQYYDKLDFVFRKEDGHNYYPSTISNKFSKVRKAADLPDNITPHTCRHTHASLLLQAGVHPKIVQERLGHASITETLDTYSHLIPTMQEEAVEKLDQIMDMKED
ncbi:MAG: tyrosine-type recombinase/integrase, partial [Halanaerobiales bacterium]